MAKRYSRDWTPLLVWWDQLKEHEKGERAFLRRCSSADEAVYSPAYHRLRAALSSTWDDPPWHEQLEPIAALAAHVKEHAGDKNIAAQMATSSGAGEKPAVSGLRFRRLLSTDERSDLFRSLVRVIRLLNGRVNLLSLADSVYWWNERTRRRWAHDYYNTAPNAL